MTVLEATIQTLKNLGVKHITQKYTKNMKTL